MSRLTDINYIKDLLGRHGFSFSKSLGQNFLREDFIVQDIVDAAEVTDEDIIIEVGPGIGVMTEELANRAKKVITIEIDKSLLPILDETIGHRDNVVIINEDILKVDFDMIKETYLEGRKPKIVANLPYYITTPIIMRFLEEGFDFTSMTVMMQKEVADRITAEPNNKNYGTLSVAVQYYTSAKVALKVPRGVFVPAPNVDSAVLNMVPHDNPPVTVTDRKMFFKTVKAAFSTRRKTLLNAMSNMFNKDLVRSALEDSGIDPKRRGETLSMDEFALLANSLSKLNK